MKITKVTLKLLVLNNKHKKYFCPNKNVHFYELKPSCFMLV